MFCLFLLILFAALFPLSLIDLSLHLTSPHRRCLFLSLHLPILIALIYDDLFDFRSLISLSANFSLDCLLSKVLLSFPILFWNHMFEDSYCLGFFFFFITVLWKMEAAVHRCRVDAEWVNSFFICGFCVFQFYWLLGVDYFWIAIGLVIVHFVQLNVGLDMNEFIF